MNPPRRYALYTTTNPDDAAPILTKAWQHDTAEDALTLRDAGTITRTYTDTAITPATRWNERPAAAALLAAAATTPQPFDAVIVGSSTETLAPNHLPEVWAHLTAHGVALFLPEVGGEYDPANPDHGVLLTLSGIATPPTPA